MRGIVNGQDVSQKHPVMDTAHYDRISHYKKLDWVTSISLLGVKTPEIPEDSKLPAAGADMSSLDTQPQRSGNDSRSKTGREHSWKGDACGCSKR